MKKPKKEKKDEIRRMKASFIQLSNPKSRKPNFTKCLNCKKELGNNFVLVYKRNNELKGKLCMSCNALEKK